MENYPRYFEEATSLNNYEEYNEEQGGIDLESGEGCQEDDANMDEGCQADDANMDEATCSASFDLIEGLEFETEEDAFEYYNSHAKKVGFSARKGSLVRSKVTKEVTCRRFVCAKEGFRRNKDKAPETLNTKNPRAETREGCKAFMAIRKVAEKWILYSFQNEHSHAMVTPSKVHRLRSHRRMSSASKSLIDSFYNAGIKPSKIMKVFTDTSGGHKHVGFIDMDCTNHLKKGRRQNNVDGDCYRVIEYLQRKQEEDLGFFWQVQVDTDGSMRSIFWADSRSRKSYSQFGDVVVFDTTYKTNKYLMPFAPFTGVNHHKQSILFGCALLADETTESFVWLFTTFLRAMCDCHPVSILTDQDRAMGMAIREVMPSTRHRFCLWHIKKNASEQLKHVYFAHPEFKGEYEWCIEGSHTSEEFEQSWHHIIERYGLMGNSWLTEMFRVRSHWVPCYLRDTFFAGMSTTQRSESINSFFDGFLSPRLALSEFILQYEKALESRREAENAEDHNTQYTKRNLISRNSIEIQEAKLYTRKMFIEFQKEFLERDSLPPPKKVQVNGFYKTYEFCEGGLSRYFVTFEKENLMAACTCQMFDFQGIPCRHMLRIFQIKDVQELPSQYILRRWTMLAKFVGTHEQEVIGASGIPTALMIWRLREASQKVTNLGSTSMKKYQYAIENLDRTIEHLSNMDLEEMNSNAIQENYVPLMHDASLSNEGENFSMMSSQISIRDPHRVKPKGRPSNARLKSGLEQAQKRTRTCSLCGETGHDMRTCSNHQLGRNIGEDSNP